MQIARGVRIMAAREGAIILSPDARFLIREQPGYSFVSDFIPALYESQMLSDAPRDFLAPYVRAVYDELQGIGILHRQEDVALARDQFKEEPRVGFIRKTYLTDCVEQRLTALGLSVEKSFHKTDFVIADFAGLDLIEALKLARRLHESESPSISVWGRGPEFFCGPLAIPFRTACWNCCHVRLSDSLHGGNDIVPDRLETIVKTVTENVFLAVRFPDIAAYGYVLVDDNVSSSLHSVVPVPWCDVCNFGARDTTSYFRPYSDSAQVPSEMRVIADNRGGIIRRLLIFNNVEGKQAPRVPYCCSAVVSPPPRRGERRPVLNGEGKGATPEHATQSAIGEAIERYSASIWNSTQLVHKTFDETRCRAFDPRWLVLYDDAQYEREDFPFTQFEPNRKIFWTTGQWLDTGEAVLIPALATYMNFPANEGDQFCQTTSNGLAAGNGFEDAALRALYELIERDAFMLFWLARRPGIPISIDYSDDLTTHALRETARLGARTELYLIDTGTEIPTIVCLGFGDGASWPGVTIGLGTDANVKIALSRAVFEHGHYGAYIRRLMQEGRHLAVQTAKDVVSALDHGLYYVHPAHTRQLDSFRSGKESVSLSELRKRYQHPATLDSCVRLLSGAGIRTAAVDVTSPDIALTTMRVVRAFGQYMQPLHFGVGNFRLQNPRLDDLLHGAPELSPHPVA